MKVTGARARPPACVQGILPLPVARCLGHESGVPGMLRENCFAVWGVDA